MLQPPTAQAASPNPLGPSLQEKYDSLRRTIHGYGSALVCFSGGVDSTLLLAVTLGELGERCMALTAVSPTMARSEKQDAVLLGQELGLGGRHVIVDSHELDRPGFAKNPTDRCYYCKSELLELTSPLAKKHHLAAVLLGTNVDDLSDHRPGLAAASERGAMHPMVDARLTKTEVRSLSRFLGLRTWDKPQLACLSSRFPYGTEITPERLARVDRFEDGARALGFRQLRLRFHEDLARLELDPDEMVRAMDPEIRARLVSLGRELGFTFVTLDLQGYRTGSMNDGLITLGKHPRVQ
ncbi:MAG: ATP-dependent sacrificial sulfur transferase LarE [Deltaproteobacteria bacterium]|nr:ATP-dependent sacrificial sulfur transferase LarE [Deltaproteobacteria bacterium]